MPFSAYGRGLGGDRVDVDGDLGNLNYTDSFTFCGFCKMHVGGPVAENKRLLGSAASTKGFFVNVEAGTRKLWAGLVNPAPINISAKTDVSIRPGEWYFWAVAWSGSAAPTVAGMSMVLASFGRGLSAFTPQTTASNSFTAPTNIATGEFTIGARIDNDLEWFGHLHDIQYHTAALTVAELYAIYHRGEVLASLSSRWLGPDAAGAGATVFDEVGTRHGTVGGAPSWSTHTPWAERSAAGVRSLAAARLPASGRSPA